MDTKFMLFFCLLQLYLNYVQCQDEPIVVTSSGSFQGTIMASRRNRTIYAFRGIRYAESTEGNLRFQPPQPILSYNETVDATADGPLCPQPVTVPGIPMSEDCLRINIFTRWIPKKPPLFGIGLAPVVFYLHGGGFYLGGGLSVIGGPQYLLDQNIVLVTINYRLGALGFISTGTAEAPGNNGLKDQVVALRWVQKFISFFGGDPNRITLLGLSAGSFSASLHVLSPMSQGLFHRVIMMSSSGISQIQIQTQQLDLAKRHAGLLNCDNSTAETIINCLKTLPAMTIAQSAPLLLEFANAFPIVFWLPVVEEDFGQERFLTEDPTQQLQSGRFNHVPIVLGISKYEFGPAAFDILRDDNLRTQLDEGWNTTAPIILLYERDTERSNQISQELRQFYLGSGPLLNDNATAEGLWKLIADGTIGYSMHRYAYLMAEVSSQAVYYCEFTYKGRFGNYVDPVTGETIGPVHATGMIYILPTILDQPITLDDPESDMVDTWTAMIANHAAIGRPIRLLFNQPVLAGARWPRLRPPTLQYLDIGQTLNVGSRLNDDRYIKWDELFPLRPIHGGEIIYTLPTISDQPITLGDPDSNMVDTLTAMFANHAAIGRPIRRLFNHPVLIGARWPRLRPQTLKYLDIGQTLNIGSRLNDDRYVK